AGGPHGRGADRVEHERTRAVEGVARGRARTFATAGRCPASAAERSSGATLTGASGHRGGWRAGAWAARTPLESQDSRGHRTAQSATVATAGLRGVRSHAGQRASGATRAGREPGDPAEVDECRRAVADTPTTSEAGARVAPASFLVRRTGDDGQFALPLAGRARPCLSPDCPD